MAAGGAARRCPLGLHSMQNSFGSRVAIAARDVKPQASCLSGKVSFWVGGEQIRYEARASRIGKPSLFPIRYDASR